MDKKLRWRRLGAQEITADSKAGIQPRAQVEDCLSALLGSRGVRGPILAQGCDGAGNKLSQLITESAPVRFLYRFPDGTKPLVIAETN
jgi:hypothetical protein